MAALQNYARLKLFLDGTEVTQVTSLSMSTASGNQTVDLLNEGLGGFTEGAGRVTVEIGYAVPLSGTEYPFQERTAAKDFVDVQIIQGAQQYVGRGKFEDTGVSQSTSANLEGTASWIGELAPFQNIV